MDREAGEENVGVETVCFADAQLVGSQGSHAAFVISQDAIPDHTFTRHDDNIQDSLHGDVHVDTPIASVCKVTDVDISTRVPTTTVAPRFVPVTGLESGGALEGDNVDPRPGCQQNPLSTPTQGRTSIFRPPPSPKVADVAPQTSVDEEIVRFMEITLNGMAQVQDGLRGVFAIQKRRRTVQKRKMAVGSKYNK